MDREALGFIQNDDGVGDVVEFSGAGSLCRKERFVELDGGGDDDGCVPVFGGESGSGGLVFFLLGCEIGVMFDDDVFA